MASCLLTIRHIEDGTAQVDTDVVSVRGRCLGYTSVTVEDLEFFFNRGPPRLGQKYNFDFDSKTEFGQLMSAGEYISKVAARHRQASSMLS